MTRSPYYYSHSTEFAKSHGKKVGEIMTEGVVAVSENTPLADIASLFERKRIKRVPVIRDGVLVGIVSRSNRTGCALIIQAEPHRRDTPSIGSVK